MMVEQLVKNLNLRKYSLTFPVSVSSRFWLKYLVNGCFSRRAAPQSAQIQTSTGNRRAASRGEQFFHSFSHFHALTVNFYDHQLFCRRLRANILNFLFVSWIILWWKFILCILTLEPNFSINRRWSPWTVPSPAETPPWTFPIVPN